MKAHQRSIRETLAIEEAGQNLFGSYWNDIDVSFDKAVVKEIGYVTAKSIILRYEWLGNMGTTEFAFGLYFDMPKGGYLGGVVCFGRTSGTNAYASVCGAEHKDKVITLCRGACVHWSHEHSASFLISAACRLMTDKGFYVFLAYADPEAGEIGTVYQACNWLYCGRTGASEMFKTPQGEIKGARLVSAYTRDRRGGELKYLRTRAEQKKTMEDSGFVFFKSAPKHRYVGLYGPKFQKRALRKALMWTVLSYPKRENTNM